MEISPSKICHIHFQEREMRMNELTKVARYSTIILFLSSLCYKPNIFKRKNSFVVFFTNSIMKIWHPKLNLLIYNEMCARVKEYPLVPYFHNFTTYSHWTWNIYLIWPGRLIYRGDFLFVWKIPNLHLLLRRTISFLDRKYNYFNFYGFMQPRCQGFFLWNWKGFHDKDIKLERIVLALNISSLSKI